MGFLKEAEIGFRRFLVLFLGLFVNRSRPFDSNLDFNSCKFLFVRQDRIGDVLVSTPLFVLLKKAYPNTVVDILLSSNNYSVLDHEPMIRKRWMYTKSFAAIWRLIFEIRREHYDFVVDLMDNPSATSTLFLALAKGKWNVGLTKDNSYVYDVKVPLLSRRDVHIVERLVELLRPFRITPNTKEIFLHYSIAESSKAFAQRFWESQQLHGKKVVGLNISSGSETRFWGVKNFRELLQSITSSYPEIKMLILFHPRDTVHAQEIAQAQSNVLVSPRTETFDQFAAVIQRLSILTTPDTSAVHLAAAFQIPSVVLYVQSNKDLRIWEPYNSPTESLITDVDDLTTISKAQVFNAFQRLVQRYGSPTAGTISQYTDRP